VKVPKDPSLYLTVFTGIGVTVVMAFWLLTPVYTPHLEESEHAALLKPEQAIGQADALLTAAEKTLADMDAKTSGGGMKGLSDTSTMTPTSEASTPKKIAPTSLPDAHAGRGMGGEHLEPAASSHSHEAGGDHGH